MLKRKPAAVRAYREEDRAAVVSLLVGRLFPDAHRLAAYWDWQFEQNPSVDDPAGCRHVVLAEDGSIAGFLAVQPLAVRHAGGEGRLLAPMHLVAAPGYGWYMLQLLRDLTSAAPLAWFSSIGNPTVEKIVQPLTEAAPLMADRVLPLGAAGRLPRLLRRLLPVRRPSGIRPVREFPRSGDQALAQLTADGEPAVVRDSARLNWRYARDPLRQCRCWMYDADDGFGYVVLAHAPGAWRCYLQDLAGSSRAVADVLQAWAVAQARACGAVELAVPLPPRQWTLPLPVCGARNWPLRVRCTDAALRRYWQAPLAWNLSFGDTETSCYCTW